MRKEDYNSKEITQKQLVSALANSSDDKVLSMLIDLKVHGEVFYLNTLLNMLTGERSTLLKKALVDFISDIKIKEAAPIIVNYIEQHAKTKDVSMVITASWQSRLDFSGFLPIFIKLLIEGSYKSSFEAFTVIENSLETIPAKKLDEYIALIKGAVGKVDRDKQLLLLEMISVLDKTKRAAL